MLERVGTMIRQKAEELEEMVSEFEAKLLAEKPPPA
jgi:hypothetical protein